MNSIFVIGTSNISAVPSRRLRLPTIFHAQRVTSMGVTAAKFSFSKSNPEMRVVIEKGSERRSSGVTLVAQFSLNLDSINRLRGKINVSLH